MLKHPQFFHSIPADGFTQHLAERMRMPSDQLARGSAGRFRVFFGQEKNGSNSKKIRFTKKLLDLTDLTTKHGDCKAQSTCDMRNKLDVLSINNRNIKNM